MKKQRGVKKNFYKASLVLVACMCAHIKISNYKPNMNFNLSIKQERTSNNIASRTKRGIVKFVDSLLNLDSYK